MEIGKITQLTQEYIMGSGADAPREELADEVKKAEDMAKYYEVKPSGDVVRRPDGWTLEEPIPKEESDNPLDTQVGGNHYKDLPVQPGVFCFKNGFTNFQSNVIKRLSRYNLPGGSGLKDLRKAQHEIDLIIKLEGLE